MRRLLLASLFLMSAATTAFAHTPDGEDVGDDMTIYIPRVRCTAINEQGQEFSAERILRRVAERTALRQCQKASNSPCQIKECVRT